MTTTERTWINVDHEGHPYRLRAAWHRMESPIEIHAPNGLEPVPTGWSVADIPEGPEEIGTRTIKMLARESEVAYPAGNDTDEAPSPANRFAVTAAACTVARIARRAGLERLANWVVRTEWDRLDHTIAPEIGWYDLAARCPWAFNDARGYRDRIGRLIQPTSQRGRAKA